MAEAGHYNGMGSGSRMKISPSITLSALFTLLAACSAVYRGTPPAGPPPDDFQLQYEWQEGSLPPPYYYEYTIRIGPSGEGEIEMIPDYPSEETPVWREAFTVEQASLEALYQLLAAQGAFAQDWQAQEDPPVGGSSERLSVTASGRTVEIPAYVLAGQEAAAADIYAAVRESVPPEIWEKLNARREQYVEEHGG